MKICVSCVCSVVSKGDTIKIYHPVENFLNLNKLPLCFGIGKPISGREKRITKILTNFCFPMESLSVSDSGSSTDPEG